MAGLLIGVFLLFGSVALPVRAEEPRVRDMRVTDATGQVTLKTADQPGEAAVVEETPLAAGDGIETGPKSSAELTIDGESVIQLQPGSRLQIKKLFQRNTLVELPQGAMLAKVKPATSPDQGLYIKLPTAVVAIRGTEFGAASGGGISHVGVFDEGHAAVGGIWGHQAVRLAPNQETSVPRSNVPQPPRKLDYFKKLKTHMPHLRNRAVFWHKHWKPITVERRHAIRQRLVDPHRSKSQGFLRTPERAPVRHTVRPHRSHTDNSTKRKYRATAKDKKNEK